MSASMDKIKAIHGALPEFVRLKGLAHSLDLEAVMQDVVKAENTFTDKLKELKQIADAIHYPDCWDTMAYPTLLSAIEEIGCSECKFGGGA